MPPIEEQQHVETPPAQPAAHEPGTSIASRDDLIAAVREAGGTESVDVAAEEAAAKPADPAAPAADAVDPDEPRIASILRAREKATAEREAARNIAAEMIDKARAESERMMRESRERADREWQEELARKRQAFQANPTEQIRALGNPQEIVDAVLRDGTPEERARQQMARELAEAKQGAAVAADVKKQLEDFRAELHQSKVHEQIQAVRREFLQVAAPDKVPYLHARYSEDEIFDKADSVAKQWRQGGLEIGKDFDFNDVAQYLELESKKKLAPLLGSTPANQVPAGAPPKAPGNAPKVSANSPRTLSAANGSERRTSPKPLTEMSASEARAALIEEVAAARRANPTSVY